METRIKEVKWPSGRITKEKQALCSYCNKWVHITSGGIMVPHDSEKYKFVSCEGSNKKAE